MIHSAYNMDFDVLYAGIIDNVNKGYINKKENGDLELFNYTPACTYDKAWNPYTLISRGLILCPSLKCVVASPLEKFFNYGEVEIPEECKNMPFVAYEKVDGSCAIIYHWNNDWNVVTRGSFISDQAVWANEWLHNNVDLSKLKKGYTYICEAVYPENRIVVNYNGFEGLVFLCAYDNVGRELTNIKDIANDLGLRVCKTFNYNSLDDILNDTSKLSKDEEGFVVRFDNGFRIKIKGDEYIKLHKLLSSFSRKMVWEFFSEKEDFCTDDLKKSFPEEFWADITSWTNEIKTLFNKKFLEITDWYNFFKEKDCKEIGLYKNSNSSCPSYIYPFIFDMKNKKSFNRKLVFKIIKKDFISVND